MTAALAIYCLGLIPAIWCALCVEIADGYAYAARIVFWPLFAIKGLLKVCRACWRELLA